MSQETFVGLGSDAIVSMMLTNPACIDSVFEGLSNKAARIKFGCAKSLLLLSEKRPDLLVSKVDRVLGLFDSENQILKWNAIAILGNLASADCKSQIRGALQRLYGFLSSGELITANHAIAALAKVGCAFPKEQKKITSRLLAIEYAEFDTGECRNIAIGKVLEALKVLLNSSSIPEEVIEFANRQTANSRSATAKRAASFLRTTTAVVR